MPRYVVKRKGRLKTKVRAQRAGILRYRKGGWIDPFPWVHGTLPEKMVYAELSRRGIPFLFLNDFRYVIPEIDFDKWYQHDFVIREQKIIIEVQGSYWHSKPETIEADAFKFAVAQTQGWTVLAWWDFDILENIHVLFEKEPKLRGYKPISQGLVNKEQPVEKRTLIDSSKGIRTLNRRRAARKAYKKPAVRLRIRR